MCVDQLTLLSSSCDEKEAEIDVCRFVVWGVLGRYPSGQRGQTVNLLPSASKVRILACPPSSGLWAVGVWGLIEGGCGVCSSGLRLWREDGRA